MLETRSISHVDTPAARRAISKSDVLVGALLLVVLLFGGAFRFVGRNWDDYTHLHPDERFLTGVAISIDRPLSSSGMNLDTPELNQAQYETCLSRYPDSAGQGGFFDAQCSTLNPHNVGHGLYVYGTLPLFLTRWTAEFVVQTTGDTTWVSYDGIHLVWRTLSAIADTLVIAIVFATGLRLHGKWVGLVAVALYAGTVFGIQQAHFGTTDAMTNLFVALAFYFAVRVQTTGNLGDYVLFGAAFGCALASRVNVAPLVGVIVLAALVRMMPALDRRLAWGERDRALTGNVVGLVLAGIFTILFFRVFNPYAFMGPGFFGIAPNPEWLEDVGEAQRLVSGMVEMPPNWQWVGRPSYIFPFTNMVLWGMGLPLGLAAWLGFGWALVRIVRGRERAMHNLLPVAWVAAYFGLLGGQWVMTMRYYLPIYPALVLLAAWALVTLVQRARNAPVRRVLATTLLVGVVGLTLLWAAMFTNIYRHQLTSVQAGIWVWENAPGDFSMQIEDAPPGTPLMNVAFFNGFGGSETDISGAASQFADGQIAGTDVVAPASGMITSVHAPHLGDPNDDPDPESLRITVMRKVDAEMLAQGTLTANLARENNVIGDSYDIAFDEPLVVQEGETYTFTLEVVSGGPVISSGAIFSWEGDWDEPAPAKTCTLPPGITLADDPPPGLLPPSECNGRDAWGSLINGYKLQLIYDDVEYKQQLMQTALDNSDYIIIGSNRRYDSQNRIPDRWPMTMNYYEALFNGELGFEMAAMFQETFELGPLRVSDQYLPFYDAPDWLNEFEAEEAFHVYDHPVLFIFRKTDAYSSDNTARILGEVPLANNAQVNVNCREAASLATVNFYCDPTLVGITNLRVEGFDVSLSADQAPLSLNFSDEMRDRQYSGGTWSNRFNPNSPINSQPILTVVGWWLAMMLFGWAAFPMLFVAFPGLADRGYGFAKFIGMFVVAWLAWFVASARMPAWSQLGVLLALVFVGLVSAFTLWRSKANIAAYIVENWRRLLAIEILTLILFVVFLGVRLSNPDLWHPAYGGEKPMDFAYFNGVLRSTVFPAIDPWFAGGYINYYYFGFVIVGAPVLLLGVVPSIAYNLIVPTLFALTGIAAFSVGFNVVAGWRQRRAVDADTPENVEQSVPTANPWLAGIAAMLLAVVFGNLDTPRIMFGEIAELGGYTQPVDMQTFLVNQYAAEHGEPPPSSELVNIFERVQQNSFSDRVQYELSNALASLQSLREGISKVLQGETVGVSPDRWFWGPTRVLAEPPVNSGGAIAELPYFTFLYGDLHAHMIAMPLQLFVMGFLLNEILVVGHDGRKRLAVVLAIFLGALAAGMLRATNTWDWVTFAVLGVAGLSFAWWLRWRDSSRDNGQGNIVRRIVLTVGIGALAATAILYLVTQKFGGVTLLAAGIGAACIAWWLFWQHITRRSLVDFALRVGGFVVLHLLVVIPYTTWYAATYNRVLPWEGTKTPLWAYFDIHGLFLFLIFSLLMWDTGRWLRSTYVRALRGMWSYLLLGFVGLMAIIAASAVLAAMQWQVSLIAMPMIAWIAILFFRSGQTRAMRFVLALAGLALALTLAVEYVVLDGDIGRQNTVFKFYIQVWLLFSIAGGAAFAWLAASYPNWSRGLRLVWGLVLGVLVFVSAMFPFFATPGKAVFRMSQDVPLTLDGMEYMRYATQYEGSPPVIAENPESAPFPLLDDYNVIRWLQQNVEGTPVIMEGRSDREYLWGSRISIYTGLPSVVGWNWHQRQQRTFNPLPRLVEGRVANVNAFYMTLDIETAWDILSFYDVSYVIVSGLERAYYPAENLAKLDVMVDQGLLEVAYQEGSATIYRVIKDATLERTNERAGLVAS